MLGGLLLDDGVKLGEEAVENGGIPGVDLSVAPIDDNTRLLLQIAIGLLGVVGATIGACTHHPSMDLGLYRTMVFRIRVMDVKSLPMQAHVEDGTLP